MAELIRSMISTWPAIRAQLDSGPWKDDRPLPTPTGLAPSAGNSGALRLELQSCQQPCIESKVLLRNSRCSWCRHQSCQGRLVLLRICSVWQAGGAPATAMSASACLIGRQQPLLAGNRELTASDWANCSCCQFQLQLLHSLRASVDAAKSRSVALP